MSFKFSVLATILLASVLFFGAGCQEQNKASDKTAAPVAKPEPVSGGVKETKADTNEPPIITFEKEICDFGEVGPDTKNNCEFKFTNTSKKKLRIKRVQTTCGCTVADLDKLEYAPGESGVIKVSYRAGSQPGKVTKYLYVHIDDEKTSKFQLTLQAETVLKIKFEPEQVTISLKDGNVPDIKVSSADKMPFAIKGFRSTGNAITAEYDPNVKATEFILKPKVDVTKIQQPNGSIGIDLTHPETKEIVIGFNVISEFNINPPSIIVFNVEPQKPITKEIWILNNYDEDFEIESVSSQSGIAKVLNKEKVDNRYKVTVELMPPANDGKRVFTDTLNIVIKGGKKLQVNCRGFYLKDQKK
jgi:hypothetical protein